MGICLFLFCMHGLRQLPLKYFISLSLIFIHVVPSTALKTLRTKILDRYIRQLRNNRMRVTYYRYVLKSNLSSIVQLNYFQAGACAGVLLLIGGGSPGGGGLHLAQVREQEVLEKVPLYPSHIWLVLLSQRQEDLKGSPVPLYI